jgi:hypothetical protein
MACVGESEAGVAGCAAGQGRCEDAGRDIVVVVDLGGVLARVGPQDPPGLLHEAALEGDGCGEEEGIQRRTVEALADVGPRRDDEQRRAVWRGSEAFQGCASSLHSHPAAKYHRIAPNLTQDVDQPVDVAGPLGQDQAVPATFEGSGDVSGHLPGPRLVGDQGAVDRCDSAGSGRVGSTAVSEHRGMHDQHRFGSVLGRGATECAGRDCAHRVPNRPGLQRDEIVELVSPIGGGRQAEPASRRDLSDRVLERRGGDVVTFVDHHQPVPASQRCDVLAVGKGLQRRDVDGAPGLRAPAAELSRLDTQQLT